MSVEMFETHSLIAKIFQTKKVFNFNFDKLKTEEVSFLKKITYSEGFIPDEIISTINKIISDLYSVKYSLIPAFELGLKFNIYLVGGSLRDLLLNNHKNIKDLDILLSCDFESRENKKVLEELSFSFVNKVVNHSLDIDPYKWAELDNKQKFLQITSGLIKNNFDIESSFTLDNLLSKNTENVDYRDMLNKDLEAVFTINNQNSNQKTNYPFDLLVTSVDIHSYIKKFSFDFCKVFLPVFEVETKKLISNSYDFIRSIDGRSEFLTDGINKTMTLKMYHFHSIDVIKKIINKHYNRIQNKYQDYEIVLDPGKNEEYQNFKNSFESYIRLNKSLPINEKEVVIKPNIVKI